MSASYLPGRARRALLALTATPTPLTGHPPLYHEPVRLLVLYGLAVRSASGIALTEDGQALARETRREGARE